MEGHVSVPHCPVCLPCHKLCCLGLRSASRRERSVWSGDLLHCLHRTDSTSNLPTTELHPPLPSILGHFLFFTCLRGSCPSPQEFSSWRVSRPKKLLWGTCSRSSPSGTSQDHFTCNMGTGYFLLFSRVLPLGRTFRSKSHVRSWTQAPLMRAGASEQQSQSWTLNPGCRAAAVPTGETEKPAGQTGVLGTEHALTATPNVSRGAGVLTFPDLLRDDKDGLAL